MIAVTSDGDLQITNVMDQHRHSEFIIDVELCAMVIASRNGDWKPRWNADKTVLENHTVTLTQAKDDNFQKHEANYAAASMGHAFNPFKFVIDSSAVWRNSLSNPRLCNFYAL